MVSYRQSAFDYWNVPSVLLLVCRLRRYVIQRHTLFVWMNNDHIYVRIRTRRVHALLDMFDRLR